MADGFRVEVSGLRQFRRALATSEKALPRELRKGLNEVGRIVVADARPRVPVRSGRLAATMRPLSTQTEGRVVLGSARTPYAQAVYWGTGPRPGKQGPHNIKPHPVMHEAITRQKIPVVVALRAVLHRLAVIIETS